MSLCGWWGEALGCQVEWDPYLRGATVTSPGAAYDAGELYWLSRIICAESGAESMSGQIAVGNVILNRVRSGSFPNTVEGVIFDRKDAVQFEPVSNGRVYLRHVQWEAFVERHPRLIEEWHDLHAHLQYRYIGQ